MSASSNFLYAWSGEMREGGCRAGCVRCLCQAELEIWLFDHYPPAARLIAERCKVGAGAGGIPPRPHVAAARGAGSGAQGGPVTVLLARGPHYPPPRLLSLPLSPPKSGWASTARRDPPLLRVSGRGREAGQPRRLRRAVQALRKPTEAGAQVAEGPDPCAPRSSLNPPLFPWQQAELS